MKKLHLVVAAILVFAVGSAFTATKFVAESKANKAAFVNTYYVVGKSGSGPSAMYSISTTPPGDCGTTNVDPCEIRTNLTFGATAPQSTVNNPTQVTIQSRHTL